MASVFRNDAVQVAEYEYDFAVDGGATGAHTLSSKTGKSSLPSGAVVKQVLIVGQTALAGSSASAKFGNSGSTALYKAQVTATLYTASAVFAYSTPFNANANNRDIVMTINGAALTAGKLKVLVEYCLPNTSSQSL